MKWSLITVMPKTDLKVASMLAERFIPSHAFRHNELSKSGTMVPVLTFPGYVFVTACDCWIAKHLSDDILGPVKIGDDVARVPDGLVERLCKSCSSDDILPYGKFSPPSYGMIPGCKVLVTGGALTGQTVRFLHHAYEKGKSMIEVLMMGCPRITMVVTSLLRVVEEAPKRKRYIKRDGSQLTAIVV